MLDVEHEAPHDFDPGADVNNYTFGSIGRHNIVIASLPDGKYGLVSAASVARAMVMSFPKVRFGLMVGIGAGIPRPGVKGKDVRLGDVVVSRPDGTSGGVVQYDLGKVIENAINALSGGGFERKGSLNSPPMVLLTAISALRAKHKRLPSEIPKFLREMIDLNPMMAEPSEDETAYVHPGSVEDPLSHHPRHNKDSTDPRIFYGVIASGNRLVKNATERDLLIKITGEDCLCLEMEAAGLMDQFPCMVIRGICDYADNQKNDVWQPYAAAVAAAYAKELLRCVVAQNVASERPATEYLPTPAANPERPPVVHAPFSAPAVPPVSVQQDRVTTAPQPSPEAEEAQRLRDEVASLKKQVKDLQSSSNAASASPPSSSTSFPPRGSQKSPKSAGVFSRASLDASFAKDRARFKRVIDAFFKGSWPRFSDDWGASSLERIEKDVMQPLGIRYSIPYEDSHSHIRGGLPLGVRLRGLIGSVDSAADRKSLTWKLYQHCVLSLAMVCQDYLGYEVFDG
jgi:nucleoside phosphorylase